MRRQFVFFSIIAIAVTAAIAHFAWPPFWWALVVIAPLVLLGLYDMLQDEHTIVRNFPLAGRGRYLMEALRPKIYQYFVESDIDGTPINRIFRSVVYQREKGATDTVPFGTELDVNSIGYEWMNHSLAAHNPQEADHDLRVKVGGTDCNKPYNASILNISAMSYGALSKNAILALNGGAQIGNFAHNTGEGSISPYHLEPGGDLIWQIGTGYFGCRSPEGSFSDELFAEKSQGETVRMIEIKLSQGAKPGHGGILPASKNSPEIAAIRTVPPHTDVISPPSHTAFSTPLEMVAFIQKLRDLSGGKPIGFKLCVGIRSEFLAICKAMIETGIKPDFITVDGGEGGTGAAPIEYSNSVGFPLNDGLAFVVDALVGFDLKKDIRIIASGKILTGFHLLRALAMGADMSNTARGMMLALGCIQALECNKNNCPTGITTQNTQLMAGLVVSNKRQRVTNYHHQTVKSVAELLTASGLDRIDQLSRTHIYRRVSALAVARLDEIYPYPETGCMLKGEAPERYNSDLAQATSDSFGASCPMPILG